MTSELFSLNHFCNEKKIINKMSTKRKKINEQKEEDEVKKELRLALCTSAANHIRNVMTSCALVKGQSDIYHLEPILKKLEDPKDKGLIDRVVEEYRSIRTDSIRLAGQFGEIFSQISDLEDSMQEFVEGLKKLVKNHESDR